MALALVDLGDFEGAVKILEKAILPEHKIQFSEAGWVIQQNQFHLLKIYRDLERWDDFENLRSQLITQLQLADEDHPILKWIDSVAPAA
jgi:hypothetical protein